MVFTRRRGCHLVEESGHRSQRSSFIMLADLRKEASGFVPAFADGCARSGSYGFPSGAWLFGSVQAIWTLIALRRWAPVRTEYPS